MAIFRIVVAYLLLAGCSAESAALYGLPSVPPGDRQRVAAHMLVRHDPHTGSTQVVGPLIRQNLMMSSYQIRSWTNPGDPKIDNRFQIVAAGRFPKRVYLKQAYADGVKLDTLVIDRERIGCGGGCEIEETVGIGLSQQEMARYAETGLSFKVVGRRASLVLTIPAAYFAAVLDAHRAARRVTDLAAETLRLDAIPAGSPRPAPQGSPPA